MPLVWQREKVLPCTPLQTAEHLKGEGNAASFQTASGRGRRLPRRRRVSRIGCAHWKTERTARVAGASRTAGGEQPRAQERASLPRPRVGEAGLGRRANCPPGGGSARPPASRELEKATSRLGSGSTGSTFLPRAWSRGRAQAAKAATLPLAQLRGEREGGRPGLPGGMPPGWGRRRGRPPGRSLPTRSRGRRPSAPSSLPPPRGAGPPTSAGRARGQAAAAG